VLAHRGTEAVRLTRRDFGRLAFAAVLLVVAMTAILGADFAPQRINLEVGDLVPADIVAPKALTYPNELLTEQARKDAAEGVDPQYDFTSERAITIASAQVADFEGGVRLLDTAFDTATTAKTWALWEVIPAANKVVSVIASGVNAGAATTTPTVTTSLHPLDKGIPSSLVTDRFPHRRARRVPGRKQAGDRGQQHADREPDQRPRRLEDEVQAGAEQAPH